MWYGGTRRPSWGADFLRFSHVLCERRSNKRVAIAGAELFLQINGYRLEADDDTLEEFTMAAAAAEIGLEEIRIFLEQQMKRDSR